MCTFGDLATQFDHNDQDVKVTLPLKTNNVPSALGINKTSPPLQLDARTRGRNESYIQIPLRQITGAEFV